MEEQKRGSPLKGGKEGDTTLTDEQ
jgi:hypothetical protein